MLAGLPVSALERTWDGDAADPGRRDAGAHHARANGAHCVLVSGGFTFFTGAGGGAGRASMRTTPTPC